jgi:RNA polymerase sigma factor (sigma-70 family)
VLEEVRALSLEILVDRVNKISQGLALERDNNIGAYLNSVIKYKIKTYLITKEQHLIKERNSLGKQLARTSEKCINGAIENLLIDDIMDSTMFTDHEKEILQYRMEGYTYQEIADRTGYSIRRINVVLLSMKKRLREIL